MPVDPVAKKTQDPASERSHANDHSGRQGGNTPLRDELQHTGSCAAGPTDARTNRRRRGGLDLLFLVLVHYA